MTNSVPLPFLLHGATAASSGAPVPTDPLVVIRFLTERDRMIMSVLGEHQVLTTDQLCDLAFGSLDLAQRRLLKLTRLQVLDRFRWRLPVGSQPWHYTLGATGATLVAAGAGVDPPRPAELRRRAVRLATSPRLAHLLGVNGFFCSLAADARRDPARSLEAWWSQRRCGELYGELVRPDAYGQWSEAGRSVEFFFEYDTGTESLGRVAGKLAGYAELALAGGPRHRVLIWLRSAAREVHLHERLAAAGDRCPVATANEELAAALGTTPAGAVWLVPGSRERRPLIALGGEPD